MRVVAACVAFILLANEPCWATPPPLSSPKPAPSGGSGVCHPRPLGYNGVHEFALAPNSAPDGITAGADGNVWFTEALSSKIGRITTGGVITEFPASPGSGPHGITLGADGNFWFAETYTNKIGVMTAAGVLKAEYAIPTASSDTRYVTTGSDGNVWFTETVANKLGRISPSGAITEFPLPGRYNSGPQRITNAADGNLWFTYDTSPADAVGRITPGGQINLYPIPNGTNVLPDGIAGGQGGHLWFLWFTTDGNSVGQVTTDGAITGPYALPGAEGLAGIVFAPDGRFYMTEPGRNVIGYFEPAPAGHSPISSGSIPIPSTRALPSSITVGPDGNLWFTEDNVSKIACLAPQHY